MRAHGRRLLSALTSAWAEGLWTERAGVWAAAGVPAIHVAGRRLCRHGARTQVPRETQTQAEPCSETLASVP